MLERLCVNCGKWLFRCQCREPLVYSEMADFVKMERRGAKADATRTVSSPGRIGGSWGEFHFGG